MINATIYGRLGAQPETRDAGSSTVTELRVASSHGYKERKTTTWLRVNVWGKRGEWIAQNVDKGERVICTGQIYSRTWENKDGEERSQLTMDANSVEKLDWNDAPKKQAAPARSALDDEIPF